MGILPPEFYERDTLEVAQELLGTLLVHEINGQKLAGRIVEVEAYKGHDPACHAFGNYQRKLNGQNVFGKSAELFADPGLSYVYLNYGMYWLFNVVTEKSGIAGAVLVRALEPIAGLDEIRKRRPKVKKEVDLTNGPGKLAIALGINDFHNAKMVTQRPLYIEEGISDKPLQVSKSRRIGISKAQELEWRFFIKSNPFVSKA